MLPSSNVLYEGKNLRSFSVDLRFCTWLTRFPNHFHRQNAATESITFEHYSSYGTFTRPTKKQLILLTGVFLARLGHIKCNNNSILYMYQVKFREAVIVRMIQVVPAGETPTQVSLPPTFRGITQTEPFQLEVHYDMIYVLTYRCDRIKKHRMIHGYLNISKNVSAKALCLRLFTRSGDRNV